MTLLNGWFQKASERLGDDADGFTVTLYRPSPLHQGVFVDLRVLTPQRRCISRAFSRAELSSLVNEETLLSRLDEALEILIEDGQ